PGGVESLDAGDGERAGSEVGLDRGAGDERHAVTRRDRRARGLLQPKLELGLEVAQARARAAQLVLDHLAHTRSFLHHDQRLLAQVVEPDRPAGKTVVRRAGEDNLVAEERLEDDAAVPAGGADDTELELA